MKPLSLAIVRQRYAADGGAERFVARALDALKGRGVGVILIAREWRGDAGHQTLTCNPFYLGRLWRDWSFARCVCRAVARRHFDLVQSHERLACCDIYRAGDGVHREWLAQWRRVRGPLARFAQRLSPYHAYVRHAEWKLFTSPRLKAVICNSNMVKQEIRRWFGTADNKLHVIYNGIDLEAFHPRLKQHRAELRARYGIPEQATLFLFVGSGFERKGVDALLAAMAMLPSDAQLLVVGRDKRRARYEARAAALGLAGRVQFTGAQNDVRPFYGAADALVLPTLYDPFPNVVVEALASGIGVVVSSKCGAAELVGGTPAGKVCEPADSESLAHAMSAFLSAPQARAAGVSARQIAEGMGLDAMSERLVQLYQQLA